MIPNHCRVMLDQFLTFLNKQTNKQKKEFGNRVTGAQLISIFFVSFLKSKVFFKFLVSELMQDHLDHFFICNFLLP